MKRVVVTGMAGLSPIGLNWEQVERKLRAGANGVTVMPDWKRYDGLNTRLAAPISDLVLPDHYTRKAVRSMGRVAKLAVRSSELALEAAGLIGHPILTSGRTGVANGSSSGCFDSIRELGEMFQQESTDSIKANTYTRMMPHTTAANVGLFLELREGCLLRQQHALREVWRLAWPMRLSNTDTRMS